MSDDQWPVATPRDELLARVAARGTRLRFLRRAAQGAMIASVLAVSAAGGVAVYSSMGSDGTDGSTSDLAVSTDASDPGPDRPTSTVGPVEAVEPAEGATPITDGSEAGPSTTAATGRSVDVRSDRGPDGPGITGLGATDDPSSTSPARPGSTTSTSTPVPSPAAGPETTVPDVEQENPPAVVPTMGQLRMRTTGVPTGTSLCLGEPDSEAAVPVDEATAVVVSWLDDGITRTVMAEHDGAEWRASLASLTERVERFEMVQVTVTATGPGGTIGTSHAVEVVDCS